MEGVIALLIPIALFFSVVAIIKIIVDSRLRRRLAETNASEDLIRAMMQSDDTHRRLSSLKWGMVLLLVGLAFGLISLLGLGSDDPGTYGLILGAAGLGMIGFHILGKRAA